MVFLPADYREDKEYPVLYLLHGYGGSHRTWHNKEADVILQNLYYFENVPEMIVVCPNSNINENESADGLDFYRRIIAEAPDHLKKNGVLMMEIGYDQKEAVKALLHESGRFEKIIGLTDLTGKDRIVAATVITVK